jgi:diadenosine tetraphosphatase ApaH/serine/threonine PP2A family protein phosphatase
VLAALESRRIDRYLCLGDTVGYGADPAACLEALRARDAVIVSGNHDHACIGKMDLGWFNTAARAALEWTRDQLGFDDLNALRRLPLSETVESCTLVHGSLRHPERFEYLVDLAQAVDTLTACRTPLCLAGHTHVPCFIEYDREARRVVRVLTAARELSEVRFEAAGARRCLLNPGSVGQPRDGDPRASAAVVDTDAGTAGIERVAYDVQAAQKKIRAAGLPDFLAERLAHGR